jgi:hypothetical protein
VTVPASKTLAGQPGDGDQTAAVSALVLSAPVGRQCGWCGATDAEFAQVPLPGEPPDARCVDVDGCVQRNIARVAEQMAAEEAARRAARAQAAAGPGADAEASQGDTETAAGAEGPGEGEPAPAAPEGDATDGAGTTPAPEVSS